MSRVQEKAPGDSSSVEVDSPAQVETASAQSLALGSSKNDHTHRKLQSRHIQLIGIGGTVGTALYQIIYFGVSKDLSLNTNQVQIGRALLDGGPGSLFIAFSFWCFVILSVTLCMAEMVTYLPISSPFIRFAGRFVDEALGFAAGWNFFVFEAALVPFEITACSMIINYWSSAVPAGVIITIVIILYAVINIQAVKWYGETEFWAALGKVLLIIALIFFTFVTMLGGNPLKDRFGFRYWKDPGAFAEVKFKNTPSITGDVARFLGFLHCLIQASFTIAGPDYVAMAAGETENPRKVLPRAFNAVFYRLTAFFVLGSLCVGILVPYNDQEMTDAFAQSKPGSAASPYVVAMNRLRISVFPDVVNALVLTAAFSAGNSYVYCASRSLFGLALEGKAPKILTRCTKTGVPIYCVGVVLAIALLSFLQLGTNASVVLSWFVSLVTASQLINFSMICIAYLGFHRACKAQGIGRDQLPYKALCMPYAAYFGLACTFTMTFVGGYAVFLRGNWDTPKFLFSYTMVLVFPLLFLFWKVTKRTEWRKPEEVDLVTGLKEVEEYEESYVEAHNKTRYDRILNAIFG